MSDLPERLRSRALVYHYTDLSVSALLREAAAEIDRLALAAGQADLDRCDEVLRLRAELAAAYRGDRVVTDDTGETD